MKPIPFKVEYDLKYYGGEYHSIGSFVIVDAFGWEDVNRAFEAKTGIDSCHIIHY